jgi:hypothetical protein
MAAIREWNPDFDYINRGGSARPGAVLGAVDARPRAGGMGCTDAIRANDAVSGRTPRRSFLGRLFWDLN